MSHPIFIVGCPRSGTTLAQSVLATTDQIFTLPETKFFEHLYDPCKSRWGGSHAALRYFHRIASSCGVPIPPPRPWTARTRKSAVRYFVEVMLQLSTAQGASAWLEKTPLHVRHIESIQRAPGLEHSRFIHVLRAYDETVRSLIDASQYWGWPKSDGEATQVWFESVGQSLRFVGQPGHLHLDYAALTQRPNESASAMFDFVGLPLPYEWEQKLSTAARKIVTPEEMGWKRRNFQAISAAPRHSNSDLTQLQKKVALLLGQGR